jgi:AraC-like DNA-binding protein
MDAEAAGHPGIGVFTRLAGGSLAALVGFRHHRHPHVDPPDEVFARPEVIFTTHGTWGFRSLDTDVVVDPGLVVLGRPGQHFRCRHHQRVPTDRTIGLEFNESAVRELLGRHAPALGPNDGLDFPRTVITGHAPRIRPLQRALYSEQARREPGYEFKIDLIAMELLVEIWRLCGTTLQTPGRLQRRRDRDRVEAARAYMAARHTDGLTLAAVARVAGLSPYHFSRVFRTHLGMGPHQYLVRLRIDHAARLLRTTSLPVTRICYDVGFHSLSHFITVFRRVTGMTPLEYRRH